MPVKGPIVPGDHGIVLATMMWGFPRVSVASVGFATQVLFTATRVEKLPASILTPPVWNPKKCVCGPLAERIRIRVEDPGMYQTSERLASVEFRVELRTWKDAFCAW